MKLEYCYRCWRIKSENVCSFCHKNPVKCQQKLSLLRGHPYPLPLTNKNRNLSHIQKWKWYFLSWESPKNYFLCRLKTSYCITPGTINSATLEVQQGKSLIQANMESRSVRRKLTSKFYIQKNAPLCVLFVFLIMFVKDNCKCEYTIKKNNGQKKKFVRGAQVFNSNLKK